MQRFVFILAGLVFFAFAIDAYANNPPGVPSISGPSQGFTDAPVDFLVSSDDPDIATSSPAFSSQIRYLLDWESDSVVDKTSDYLDSGAFLRETYSFSEEKIYSVQVMAEDSLGATSSWSSFSIDIIRTNESPILHSIGDKTTGEKQNLSFIVSGRGSRWR